MVPLLIKMNAYKIILNKYKKICEKYDELYEACDAITRHIERKKEYFSNVSIHWCA